MTVYVDNAKHVFRRMKMCWFQNRRVPHYDICQRQRKLAIKTGAVEIGWRQTVELMRKHGWHKQSNGTESII